ncbi:protein arginine N-methyltransferase 2 [[Candida] anglica]|uniref:Arginine N-methyltransferase 2 n=1 Tax=[Candida] anglica TaxID=148631 RepID=A0ABP0ELJ3_9ASCO
MTDLHDLCKFTKRPLTEEYVDNLKYYLKNGIPSTYTVEEAYNFENGKEDEETTSNTTPLHLICRHIPEDCTEEEIAIASKMVEILLEYGAGWCLVDSDENTPGCILIKRNLKKLPIYTQIVQAGVRAELLLRKVEEIEFVDEEDYLHDVEVNGEEVPELVEESSEVVEKSVEEPQPVEESVEESVEKPVEQPVEAIDPYANDPATNQETYLKTKLEYKDGALVTKENKDGVMMEWESELMRMGSDSLFKGVPEDAEEKKEDDMVVLNIGFGMGIIDTMIQNKKPTKHYICEAHPDVLAKLKRDGWYEKPNVVILEGRWQEQLTKLLSDGNVFFNGIYYDTYSEHYSDMLDLFDFVVGLLKPHGVFSFFNGLGADRQVVYEVYKELVEMDLNNYGLDCKFTEYEVPKETMQAPNNPQPESVWDDIKRSYWSCPVYYHPEARFMEY